MNGTVNGTAETSTVTDNDAPQRETKPRAQIARYDMVFNPQTYRYEAKKTQKPAIPKNLKKKKAIIVVKRFLGSKGQHEKTIIEIHHEALNMILQEIYGDMENILSDGDGTVDARLLYYSHGELKDRLKQLEETNVPEDLEKIEGTQAAIRYIEEDFKATIDAFNALTSKQQTTYEYLWTLFRPKTHVCAYDSTTEQMYIAVVQKFSYEKPQPPAPPHAQIECDIIAHDNMSLGRAEITLNISTFPGARSITDLPVYPLKFHEDCDALREKAIARGKVYAGMRLHFCEHHGVASVRSLKLLVNERIMVDPESSYEYGIRGDYVYQRLLPEDLSDDDHLICTPMLLGFCFTTKAWGRFAIDRITDIQWSNEPFDRLVLGSKQKRLISALVQQHTSKSVAFDDIIAGKGRGLVGLLCGRPGCGKTLTAEAVAEVTRKPLYAVSAGELGTNPSDTDEALKRILRLGERWNAVVLLDEADVFMQERDRADVTRNALVSIFLRQVEYHPGILIFTTNLIDQIDPAFESRIHFCVKYPDLDFASRKTIWRTFLNKADSVKNTFSERDIATLARRPLNGRQIKNVVSTAKSIASSEESPLSVKYIQTVLEVMQDWQVAKSERATRIHSGFLFCAAVILVNILIIYLRDPSTPLAPVFLRL